MLIGSEQLKDMQRLTDASYFNGTKPYFVSPRAAGGAQP
jgi:hypothetical protein